MLKYCKYIHGTSFSNSLAKQPKQLLIPKSGCGALRSEARCIVQAKLKATRASGPRAHLVAHSEQGDSLAILVADIRTHWRKNYVKRCVTRRRDAERGSCANERRPDVEAAPSRARNPARLERHKTLNECQQGICVEWLEVVTRLV